MTKRPPPETTDERLDLIIEHLERINRRGRMAAVRGFFHGIFSLVKWGLIFFVAYYFYTHTAELMTFFSSFMKSTVGDIVGDMVPGVSSAVPTGDAGSILENIDPAQLQEMMKEFF